MRVFIPLRVGLVRKRLVGKAMGVSQFDGDAQPVDGVYDLSTIVNQFDHRETVGFKVSGIGPSQISEPQLIKTLTVTP